MKVIMVAIPVDLAPSVSAAIARAADMYRRDKGHSPEDIALLERDADRLDQIAEVIDHELDQIEPLEFEAVP